MDKRTLAWLEIGGACVAVAVALVLLVGTWRDWSAGRGLDDALGESAKGGKNREAALYAVDRAQKGLPHDPVLTLLRASLLLDSRDPAQEDRALHALEELAERHDRRADVRAAHAVAMLRKALREGDPRDRERWMERAASEAAAAADLAPTLTEAHVVFGTVKLEMGDQEAAMSAFDRAERAGSIPTRPGLAMLYHNRGVATMRAERYDRSMILFLKAVQIDPYADPSRRLLASAIRRRLQAPNLSAEERLRATGDATSVLAQTTPVGRGKRVSRYVPEALEAELRNAIAVALVAQGDPASAVPELERALRLAKDDPVYALNRAEALARVAAQVRPDDRGPAVKRAGDAFVEASHAEGLDPELKVRALAAAGYFMAEAKQHYHAAKAFEDAIAIAGERPDLLQSIAVAYDRWNRKTDAIKRYEAAIKAADPQGSQRILLEERVRKLRSP